MRQARRHAHQVLAAVAWVMFVASDPAAGQGLPEPLTPGDAVRLYLDRNVEVAAIRLAADRVDVERIAARVRPNPNLTLTAENIAVSGPTAFHQLYEVAASYSDTIELGGKRRLRAEVADSSVEVAQAELAAGLGRGVAVAKTLYYEVALARERVGIAAETRDAFQRLVEYNQARFEEGAVARIDLINAQLEQAQLDSVLKEAELELRQKTIQLIHRIGGTDFDRAVLTEPLVFAPVELDVESLKSAAVELRPEVIAGMSKVERTRAGLSLENARNTPDITPFLGYKRVASNQTLLLGLSIPLRIRDRNQAGIARAVSDRQIAEAELGAVRSRIQAEVESAYAAYETSREQVLTFEGALLDRARDASRIARAAYEEGATGLLPLVEAERTYARVRRQKELLFDYHASLTELERAVGREIRP